jgi:beta-1,4-N-acetylglucosaminyltransferase
VHHLLGQDKELTVLKLRILQIIPSIKPQPKRLPTKKGQHSRIVIVLGSGGHTAEMISMLHTLDRTSFTRRSYVVTSGDQFSESKAVEFENRLLAEGVVTKPARYKEGIKGYDIYHVPRARDVHQPLVDPRTVLSFMKSLFSSYMVLHGGGKQAKAAYGLQDVKDFPDLVVCNGPGSAVAVVVMVLWLRFLGKCNTRTIYVESWARVKTLSLSGKMLHYCVDRFLVQWKPLEEIYSRAEYVGWLVK